MQLAFEPIPVAGYQYRCKYKIKASYKMHKNRPVPYQVPYSTELEKLRKELQFRKKTDKEQFTGLFKSHA